jgi:hypothetical protein
MILDYEDDEVEKQPLPLPVRAGGSGAGLRQVVTEFILRHWAVWCLALFTLYLLWAAQSIRDADAASSVN